MSTQENDDIWRLYHREWVIVHTITRKGDQDAVPCFHEAKAWADENLKGRVQEGDVRLVGNTDLGTTFWFHVEIFKDVMKGEFKYVSHAQRTAHQNGYEEYVIVPRNSKSDHDIRNYGVVKL